MLLMVGLKVEFNCVKICPIFSWSMDLRWRLFLSTQGFDWIFRVSVLAVLLDPSWLQWLGSRELSGLPHTIAWICIAVAMWAKLSHGVLALGPPLVSIFLFFCEGKFFPLKPLCSLCFFCCRCRLMNHGQKASGLPRSANSCFLGFAVWPCSGWIPSWLVELRFWWLWQYDLLRINPDESVRCKFECWLWRRG